MKEASYARSKYAEFTRELNKRLIAPTVVLFKTADNSLTLAFVHRRQHRYDPSRDVLGSVSLVRDINPTQPHRAHLDILAELSLEHLLSWMSDHNKSHDFDGLLAAWLDALDTEELNRRFYKDLFEWFDNAVQEATFPTNQARTLPPEEHIIRLITRLLFVWFIKEKRLIAEDLFNETKISDLLKNYDRDTGDSYYRAVLQNLFFATLNTEIGKRGFSKEKNSTHRDFSLYRYKQEIVDPEKLLALFAHTPFINGGLFDCLDSEEGIRDGGYRIDCFSDNERHYTKLSLPNRLFFGEHGLIPLFNRYKFTVEENTPVEQEVALDPELLGKVFENLLAAYNPETRQTARKQTGSYYTPRPVVDYMVDEALLASLAQQCQPTDDDATFWQERLRYLLNYEDAFSDADELFDKDEAAGIVRTIAGLKILDPAVGSGAFPMGVLHKLTLALRRIDPDNTRWAALQKERAQQKADAAFETKDRHERDAELLEISETFEKYAGDFGRKLYLIQNSIFGVDIQPIACQIAKLRFFISLAIEQEANNNPSDNYGIKPLPNLETRFIGADALLELEAADQLDLFRQQIESLKTRLAKNRERHFHAPTRPQKLACKNEDKRLRQALARELNSAGLPEDEANKIAHWDPYDQNATAAWFDAEYMFGNRDGFDVVLGNPPYVESRNSLLTSKLKEAYRSQVLVDWGDTLPRGSDLLVYFYPRAVKFLSSQGGMGCFITQNAWLSTDYGKKFQDFSLGRFSFERIIDTSAKFFSDVKSQNINAVITMFTREPLDKMAYGVADADMVVTPVKAISAKQKMKWGHVFSMPPFFAYILEHLRSTSRKESPFAFGQGLNFPKAELNDPDVTVPVIVRDSGFVAASADELIREVRTGRTRKVPALVMPRGVGSRYYCTFNLCKAYSYSHVEFYLPMELWDTDTHYCLWAYLNSSLVWLFREITGRKNLGGGMLKAEATEMKALPINFDFDFAAQARQVFIDIQDRKPLPVQEEVYTQEHLRIDAMVADCLGFADKQDDIRNTLVEQVSFRLSRAIR